MDAERVRSLGQLLLEIRAFHLAFEFWIFVIGQLLGVAYPCHPCVKFQNKLRHRPRSVTVDYKHDPHGIARISTHVIEIVTVILPGAAQPGSVRRIVAVS